jgi:very-short-patch-repair endonuclease
MRNAFPAESPAPPLIRDRARNLRRASADAERKFWAHLRNRQLKGVKFRRQHPIGPCIADFFCLEAKLIVEVDGDNHATEAQGRADTARTAYLEGSGYRVVRFWNNEVMGEINGVLERIAEFL